MCINLLGVSHTIARDGIQGGLKDGSGFAEVCGTHGFGIRGKRAGRTESA